MKDREDVMSKPIRTIAGRIPSQPASQRTPIRTDLSKQIRDAMKEASHKVMDCDYNLIERRIAEETAKDKK